MKGHQTTGTTRIDPKERARQWGEREVSPIEDMRGRGYGFWRSLGDKGDEGLRALILKKIADGEVMPESLSVTVKDGEVTLGGACRSEKDRKLVAASIQHLDGVKEVRDEMTVVAPESIRDGDVTRHPRMNQEELGLQHELEQRFRTALKGS